MVSEAEQAAREQMFEAVKIAREKESELKLCETRVAQIQEELNIARDAASVVFSGHKGKMADQIQKLEAEITAQRAKYAAVERDSMGDKITVTAPAFVSLSTE